MKKRTISVILLVTFVAIVGIVIWGAGQPDELQVAIPSSQANDDQADVILYFGQECSHCKVVEKFIAENEIDKKVIFAKKEVWHNVANNNDLNDKAKECALEPDEVGVPFLFARGKCYVGEVNVNEFLKKEAGMK